MLCQRNKRQHARTRLFVNQFFEAEKVDRSGRSGVYRRRDATGKTDGLGIETVRTHPPVTVDMEVDQTWSDVTAMHIQNFLCALLSEAWCHFSDPVTYHADIHRLMNSGGGINHCPANQQQIVRAAHGLDSTVEKR